MSSEDNKSDLVDFVANRLDELARKQFEDALWGKPRPLGHLQPIDNDILIIISSAAPRTRKGIWMASEFDMDQVKASLDRLQYHKLIQYIDGGKIEKIRQFTEEEVTDLEILNTIGDTPKSYVQIQACTTVRLPEIFRTLDRPIQQGRIEHAGDGKWGRVDK